MTKQILGWYDFSAYNNKITYFKAARGHWSDILFIWTCYLPDGFEPVVYEQPRSGGFSKISFKLDTT